MANNLERLQPVTTFIAKNIRKTSILMVWRRRSYKLMCYLVRDEKINQHQDYNKKQADVWNGYKWMRI